MTVREMVSKTKVKVLTGEKGLKREITGGYCGDLLSFVMAHAQSGQVWVTIQSHINVIAVAQLVGISCVVLAENQSMDEDVLDKAREEEIVVATTPLTSFEFITLFHEKVV